MNTTSYVAYVVPGPGETYDVPVLGEADRAYAEQTLGHAAVLLSTHEEPGRTYVQAAALRQSDLEQLERVTKLFAAEPLPETVRDSDPIVAVSYEDAADVLFAHLGHTGQLLAPCAALRLAGAVALARQNEHLAQPFNAVVSHLAVHEPRKQQFASRARRRQQDHEFGRHISPWPLAERVNS